MSKNFFIPVIILIVIVALGLLYYFGQRKEEEEISQPLPGEELLPEEELPVSLQEEIKIPEEIKAQIEEQGGVVSITADGFEPKEIILTQGEAISWVNTDSKAHQIVSEYDFFNTGEMNPGDIWIFPCNEKGTFEYWFKENPEQKGKIIVE